ncbi:exodeoxyribonuclease VII large subunit [Fonticella tunisiensis]|uniref:Exodeoxyribonuclease 7 large subunit n=1 Tax=Fonticella tunisiensis TaxID=1096341 RepID=A0A4R7KUW5_9CLOT|nr:exodeoxyribonuclease VII large subunit [Fonticella tunisiensis]TDT61940.1 exodeoxyribonuclease VII large subunit [Fonticella tunisiensis]
MIREPITVSELTSYIKSIIENDFELSGVLVRGEISNFKHHSSGHMYFTLKDENAKIKCVMFKGSNQFLKFTPEDGMNMIVSGYVSVYERDGQYQLYVLKMEPDGIGSLYLAFEQLKEKLQKEGLFDTERKKPIPLFPEKIGVATSPTGSVIRDIINVSTRRFKNVDILLYPVKVQGEGAAETIVEAIDYFNTRKDIEVIIIGRGGGSIEELWPFNEEIVARAIARSRIPIISAVGHETDFTISDFVADARASTPSHAAEMAVPSLADLTYKIESLKSALYMNLTSKFKNKRYSVNSMIRRLENNSPLSKIVQNIQYIDNLQNKIKFIMEKRLRESKNKYSILVNRLDDLGPGKILSRGFSLVEKDNKVVRSVKELREKDEIKLTMKDGSAYCKIEKIMEGSVWLLEKRI